MPEVIKIITQLCISMIRMMGILKTLLWILVLTPEYTHEVPTLMQTITNY